MDTMRLLTEHQQFMVYLQLQTYLIKNLKTPNLSDEKIDEILWKLVEVENKLEGLGLIPLPA